MYCRVIEEEEDKEEILARELRARHSSEVKFTAIRISKFVKFNSVTR